MTDRMSHIILFKQKNHDDDDDKVPHLPDEQIPINTEPGQILHIDDTSANLF